MVWLYDNDIVDFPKLEAFYMRLAESIQDQEKIWNAFLKWSCLDVSLAVNCLSWATYPIVRVNKKLTGSPYSHGHFDPNSPHEIWIERDKAQIYEKTTDRAREYQTEKYIEMLTLHELVHWGRFWTLSDDSDEDPDSGRKFAMEAYKDFTNPHQG